MRTAGIQHYRFNAILIVIIMAVVGLLALALVVVFVTRKMIRPLGKLTSVTGDIGSGNLDVNLPVPERNDEVGVLTHDFRNMRDSLKDHIRQLRETTAKQQKLESEIEIARGIQMSMVPGGGTVSISDKHYQLYTLLRPARSVGGDLYFFQQDTDRLHFIIGDVSDKGVPAALFMAKTVTLYTGALNDALSPAETLTRMNQALALNNDACMFVTALCGSIDMNTGALVMANAGHMHPLRITSDRCGELAVDGSMALGLMEDVEYSDVSHQLQANTSLLMYTDGISEAFNPQQEQYQEERLKTLLERATGSSADALGELILADVDAFVGTAGQSDDITLMVIRYGRE